MNSHERLKKYAKDIKSGDVGDEKLIRLAKKADKALSIILEIEVKGGDLFRARPKEVLDLIRHILYEK